MTPSNLELHVVDDPVGEALRLFVDEAPSVVLITGGSSPRPMYEQLAGVTDLEWEEMEFFFTDERSVPPSDPLSNFRMADVALLSKVLSWRYSLCGGGAA